MKFNFEATGIGSVPFKDPDESCRIIFDRFKHIPYWPQLPRASFYENMYVQFSEKLPGLVTDEAKKAVYIDSSSDKLLDQIEAVYGKYLEHDLDFFKISESHAKGFYAFLNLLKAHAGNISYVKGGITGPISFALFLTDQNKQSVIHNKDIFEVLTKTLAMKVKWQIRELKKVFPNVIIFIDEPYLVSIGSSYISINVTEVFERFDEVVEAIRSEGALSGIHCCGNTDWPLLLNRNIDILNFDAYTVFKEFSLYAKEVNSFTERGGTVAWGITPSSDDIEKETAATLRTKLESGIKALGEKGVDISKLSSIVTPSCGVGSLSETVACKVLETVNLLSDELRAVKQ